MSTAKMQDPTRIIQQSIQTRANLMQRKAQQNLARIGSAREPSSQAAASLLQPSGGGEPGGSSCSAVGRGGLGAVSGVSTAGGDGPAVAGATCASAGAGALDGATAGHMEPGQGQRARRLSHMTNFELERLFTLTASPSMAAAMRCGGAHAAAAVARLREAMVSQRQNTSEGYLRAWDEQGNSGVVTVSEPRVTRTSPEVPVAAKEVDEVHRTRCAQALAALPVEQLTAFSAGDPCAICQDTMFHGEAVRRLPCAHVFHSECITRWLHVKLTCPLDSLPVDEGIEMLAAAAASALDQIAAPAPAEPPPLPPASALPPLPPEPAPAPPSEPAPALHEEAAQPGPPPAVEVLPPIGLEEMHAAAAGAGVSAARLADALARRRASGLLLVS